MPTIGVEPFTLASIPSSCTCGALYWFKPWVAPVLEGCLCPACGKHLRSDNAAYLWYTNLVGRARDSARSEIIHAVEKWGEERRAARSKGG